VGSLSPNAVHISTGTVSPGLSRRVAEEHASRGQAPLNEVRNNPSNAGGAGLGRLVSAAQTRIKEAQ
jgi:hypothetical protein